MADVAPATTERAPGQLFALVLGIVYLLVGIAGFFMGVPFLEGNDGDKLLIFHINQLHNIIHVVLGAGWIWASRTAANSRQVNLIYGLTLLAVAVAGFLIPDTMQYLINVQDIGDPDNFLHLITGALALYFYWAADRSTTTTPTTTV